MRVAVIDYGAGNLRSVAKALETVGAEVRVSSSPSGLEQADRIVLPGVGAFGECFAHLERSGFLDPLREHVLVKGKPFLGICLGLHFLARESLENGRHQGLGWLPASVQPLQPSPGLPVPHLGWDEVQPTIPLRLFQGLRPAPVFYFAHSYALCEVGADWVAAICDYGVPFVAAVQRGNIVATQFHPEKSQENGLRLLRNFLQWQPG